MLKFEKYIADFGNTVNLLDFIINLIIATLLSLIIRYFFIRFGKSFSNREKFASIFVPMALATLLIITVVQASIALSLGLVGALSIVRFRAAIKEPEELTYIFLIIGVGLTCGANKPLLAIIAIAFILPLMYINSRMSGSHAVHSKGKLLININTEILGIDELSKILGNSFDQIELKRYEAKNKGLFAVFLAVGDSIEELSELQRALNEKDADARLSIMDQPDMVI